MCCRVSACRLGFTLFYLTGIVLVPLLALVIRPYRTGLGRLLGGDLHAPRAGVLAAVFRHGAGCRA